MRPRRREPERGSRAVWASFGAPRWHPPPQRESLFGPRLAAGLNNHSQGLLIVLGEPQVSECIRYLESILHVCAWCRKIEHNDRWRSLEAHFMQKTGGRVSHGICPECSERLQRQLEESPPPSGAQRRKQKGAAGEDCARWLRAQLRRHRRRPRIRQPSKVPNADKAKISGSGTAVGENWTSSKYNHHPAPPPGPGVPVVENVSCASVPAKVAMLPASLPNPV